MDKLLVVCGPTATGKTSLAISLAKKFGGEIVSADSRQVYKHMDVGTGKDLPMGAKLKYLSSKNYGYYEMDGVCVWGYDLVSPKSDFSVSQYNQIARKIIKNIAGRGKLPVLVGGAGFYIKAVIDGIRTLDIPKNRKLRKSLEENNALELYDILAQFDPTKVASMNVSDRKNPRRLVRAIEVAQSKGRGKEEVKGIGMDTLFVGLTAPRKYLSKRVAERVGSRLESGMFEEVSHLLEMGVSRSDQAMDSLGYRQSERFFARAHSKEVAVSEWKKQEEQYTKRQITWFKRDKRINWFDISRVGYLKGVESLVQKWHNNT